MHPWFRKIGVEQSGDPPQDHVLYQDNKSIILLQKMEGSLAAKDPSRFTHTISSSLLTGSNKSRSEPNIVPLER